MTDNPAVLSAEPRVSSPSYPWRRYLARVIDFNLYLLLPELICLLYFHINPNTQRGAIISYVCSFLAFGIMLLFEPTFLQFFGTTPGKWIFGLRVLNADGSKLSYDEALLRTWRVIVKGYGFCVPGYSIYCLWKCYKLCKDGQEQDWDEFPICRRYTIRDIKPWRAIVFLLVNTAIVFVTLWAMEVSALPPNRGDLTIAEFAENYNYVYNYLYDSDPLYTLNENGEWEEAPTVPGVVVVDVLADPDGPVPLEYTVDENGYLTGFTIHAKRARPWYILYDDGYLLATLALAQAQPDGGAFSNIGSRLSTQLDRLNYEDFAFSCAGLSIESDIEYLVENVVNLEYSVVKNPQH